MARKYVILALLALSACSKPVTEERAHEIAAGEANNAQPDMTAIDARLTDLEKQSVQIQMDLATLAKEEAADAEARQSDLAIIKRLSDNQVGFKANIDYLRALHGQPPMPEKK